MRRSLFPMLGVFGCILAGCALDIPNEEVGSLGVDSLCILTGGEYKASARNPKVSRCFCNDDECGENVTCRYNSTTKNYTCAGYGYTLLPSGPCMMEGVIVCGERIDSDGRSMGYYTRCLDHEWTEEKTCNGASCMTYEFKSGIMSSKCGECTNDGVSCIGGQKI